MTINNNKARLFFSYSIILLPFLYQYKGIGNFLSFGEVVVSLSIVMLLVQGRVTKIKNDKYLTIFYAVTILTTLVCSLFSYFEIEPAFTLLARLFYYAIVIAIARQYFRFEDIYKFYLIFVFLLSIYLIIQYVYHYSIGGYLPIYINKSWLFTPEARDELSVVYKYGFRPSSLFLEPSYFTLYALPAIAMLVFTRKKNKSTITMLIIIMAAIVLSTSAAGTVGLLVIMIVYCFRNTDQNKLTGKMIRIIAVGCALAIVFFYFQYSENTVLMDRLNTGGSLGQRITRGFIVFSKLSPFHQLFGVGLNNVSGYMLKNNISTIYDELRNLNYCASIPQTLLYSGIVGELSFIAYLISKYLSIKETVGLMKRTTKCFFDSGLLITLMLILLYELMYESILFSYRFAFIIIIIEGVNNYIKRDVCL